MNSDMNISMNISTNMRSTHSIYPTLKVLLLTFCTLTISGCSTSGQIFTFDEVKPWERGTLAREDMQLITDTMDQSVDDHIYFSKEASRGGSGIQGGGCGCN